VQLTVRLSWEVQLSFPFPRIATTILVVDDQRLSRRVAYRILSEEGYRVLEAESAPEALDVLSQARGRVDLLMVDVVMPECDGVELARIVLEEWPDQRILYMSAHPAEVLVQHGLESLDVPFLAKPYSRDEAIAKVRQALERRRRDPEAEPSVERRRKPRLQGK
jgi:two-component system, cell cycle sensor histidine kinase and response regulator CckA